jgi:hypothetical protein
MTADILIEEEDKILKIGDIKISILLDRDVWDSTWCFTIAGLHRAIMNYINKGEDDGRWLHSPDSYDYEDNSNVKQANYKMIVTMSLDRQKEGKYSFPIWEVLDKKDRDSWHDKENKWKWERERCNKK